MQCTCAHMCMYVSMCVYVLELEPPGAAEPSYASFASHATSFDAGAVRQTYGQPPSPDTYLRACPLSGLHSPYKPAHLDEPPGGWLPTFYDAFKGLYGTTRQAPTRLGVCCEYRLTWRLAGRMVPVRIAPFAMVGAGTRDQVRAALRLSGGNRENASLAC